ncbi:phage tail protein [Pedobacter sp. HDW13]|uniref:phage tail protein n=1 Tax=unclassified Pedobacter TaxID=2628915 RepID=UPI000F59D92F|nr:MULTISPECIES: phage tail protein [unclassified Pedobacter]QIL41547.1 phage tail protein [Pedobacter sp. HDW13]RQO77877.1 phage tail protein [Pedobacter sp. KBW01]
MANDGKAGGEAWPLPKFRFEVDLGSTLKGIAFQEVSGLEAENQIIEYRKSNSPLFSTEKMPGLVKNGNVTLKKGIFVNDNSFWDWHSAISMNIIKRRTVLIKLLDEAGKTTMQWQLNNAWPTKITSTDLKSEGNEIAVESLEIAFEQLTITNAS